MLMHFMAFSLDNLCLLVNTTQLDEEHIEKSFHLEPNYFAFHFPNKISIQIWRHIYHPVV